MRKKGKSYQKVPPYKRYGASKPSNVNLSKKKKRPSLFMILFGIFLALCLFALIYIKLDTIISITITKSGLISSVSSKNQSSKREARKCKFLSNMKVFGLLYYCLKNGFKITDG